MQSTSRAYGVKRSSTVSGWMNTFHFVLRNSRTTAPWGTGAGDMVGVPSHSPQARGQAHLGMAAGLTVHGVNLVTPVNELGTGLGLVMCCPRSDTSQWLPVKFVVMRQVQGGAGKSIHIGPGLDQSDLWPGAVPAVTQLMWWFRLVPSMKVATLNQFLPEWGGQPWLRPPSKTLWVIPESWQRELQQRGSSQGHYTLMH